MISAITLGLSALQVHQITPSLAKEETDTPTPEQLLLAIAVLVLAATVLKGSNNRPAIQLPHHRESVTWLASLRYSIFLGMYGILSALVTIASLFVSAVLNIIPLIMNIIGAVLFLIGGILWVINFKDPGFSCNQTTTLLEKFGAGHSFAHRGSSACKRCSVIEVLLFIMFPIAALLAACSFIHRRTLRQSERYL